MHKNIKKHSVLLLLFTITLLQSCLRDGDPVVRIPLEFKGVEIINSTTLKLTFSKELVISTANNPSNYTIINQFDYTDKTKPIKAKVTGNEVLLTFKKAFKTSVIYQAHSKNLTAPDGAVLGTYGYSKIAADNTFEIKPKVEWVRKSLYLDRNIRYYFNFAKKDIVNIADDSANSTLEWDVYFELGTAMLITPNASEVDASGIGKMISTDEALLNVKKAKPYIQASDAKNQGLSILAPFVNTNRMPWCKRVGKYFGDETKPVEVLNKTIVFRTAKGDYGKMKIYSIYEGNPPNPVPTSFRTYLLKFEYVVQTDHSDNLDIKK